MWVLFLKVQLCIVSKTALMRGVSVVNVAISELQGKHG